MKLPASVIISRASGGGEDQIHITIEDGTSGCRLVEIYMTLEEYARAATASYGHGEMEYYQNCPAGKVREVKHEIIPFRGSDYDKKSKTKAIALMKVHEVDGWKGNVSDLFNHHKWTEDNGVRVAFHRFVSRPVVPVVDEHKAV